MAHATKAERDATVQHKTAAGQGEDGRPSKRQRVAPAEPEIFTRTQDPELALEVDHMILDYIVYQATNAVLSKNGGNGASNVISASHNLAMIDSFLEIFKSKHPSYQPDAALRFRILLLKLTALFVERLTRNVTLPLRKALQDLRAENQNRARQWIGSVERIPSNSHNITAFENDLPLSLQDLERNRAHVLSMLSAPAEDEAYEDAFYGTLSSLTLLDVLPLFMQLSAARNAINDSNLTEQWMHLGAQFMLQACLEQYLVRGSSGSDAIDEAFSWGYKQPDTTKRDPDSPIDEKKPNIDNFANEVNEMFTAESAPDTEVEGWSFIKSAYLRQLIPPTATELKTHLEQTALKHPISDFQKSMLDFLTALLASMPAPVLVQLEKGTLDGFSEAQTAEFVRECGLHDGWPLIR